MNRRIALLLALTLPVTAALAQPAHQGAKAEASKPATAKLHPLTGVVIEVMADKQALLVKHDEIPGVMRAMTMMFRVDETALKAVRKGDAIKAKMGRDEAGRWMLQDVTVAKKPE